MRFLIIFICLLIHPHNVHAAEDPKIQSERAIVASNLFKKICFMMSMGEQNETRQTFLDSKFPRQEGEKKELFLNFSSTKNGDVWAAVFPKGAYAIVIADNGNCHVVAQKADDQIIHEQIKHFSEEAKNNLNNMTIKYHSPEQKDMLTTSGFDVIGPGGTTPMLVVITTMKNPPPNKPAAIMTVALN